MRRSAVSRPALVALGVALVIGGACARLRTGSGQDYETVVPLRPDATLRVARTQLEHHDYQVGDAGPNALVTLPTPIPPHLQDDKGHLKGRYWMLHVGAQPQRFTSGTRLRVVGYVLPASTPDGRETRQEATPVTADQRALFSEVRAAGRWIEDGANRAGS